MGRPNQNSFVVIVSADMTASGTFRPVGWLAIAISAVVVCQLRADAFQAASPKKATPPSCKRPDIIHFSEDSFNQFPETTLQAKKNPAEPEREKGDVIGLLLLYMTPWRNPNSIFVYMLLLLYVLGSISESQSAARIAGM
jgi:hypothetical protein